MKKTSLFILDIVSLYLSLYFTLFIRYGSNFGSKLDIHLLPFSIIFIFWVFAFYISNLYDFSSLKNGVIFYSRLFQTIAINLVTSLAFFYLIPFFIITPKRNLIIFTLVFSGIDFLVRNIFNRLILSQTFRKNTIIVGLNQQSLELARFIKENPQLGYGLSYIVDISKEGSSDELTEFGIIRESNLEKIIAEEKVNTVILSPAAYQLPRIIDTLYKYLDKRINFFNLSDFYEHSTGKIPLGAINQAWFLENLTEGTKKPYELARRVLDIIFSSILGAITLFFLPLLAALIKTTSTGPIFYRQKRVGQYGKLFEIIKLRTMKKDAEKQSGAVWAQQDDPRVTKLGKFLRKTRLDELPQLWNILRGEMSFVGPRAERPEFHENLKKNIPFYEERYLIRPGLSGWAQVQYRYGASMKDAEEKLQYDLFYIKNRSIALDISIILKTINIVFRQAGR